MGYRQKIEVHLSACYGDTFAEGSYWYEKPHENKFFAQLFRMAAADNNNGDDTKNTKKRTDAAPASVCTEADAAKVFVKKGKHVHVHEPALKRLGLTKSLLTRFFAQTPAAASKSCSVNTERRCIIVAFPASQEKLDAAAAAEAKETAAAAGMMALSPLPCPLSDATPVGDEGSREGCASGLRDGGGEEAQEEGEEEESDWEDADAEDAEEEEEEEEFERNHHHHHHPGALVVEDAFPMDLVTDDDDTATISDDDDDDDDSLHGDDDDTASYLPALTTAVDNLDYLGSQPMENGASQSFDLNDLWEDDVPTTTGSQPKECAVAAANANAETAAGEIVQQEHERLDKLCALRKQLETFSAGLTGAVAGGEAQGEVSVHVAALRQLMHKQFHQASVRLGGGWSDFLIGDGNTASEGGAGAAGEVN